MQLSFVTVVPKYLNLATFLKDILRLLIPSVYPAFSSWDMHVYLVLPTICPTPPSFMQLTQRILKIHNSLLIDFLSYLIFSHCNCVIFFEILIMVTSRIREYMLWKIERTAVFWGTMCGDQNINKHLRYEDFSLHKKKTRPLFLSVFLRMCRVCILIRK
jgi:hypothetical protein